MKIKYKTEEEIVTKKTVEVYEPHFYEYDMSFGSGIVRVQYDRGEYAKAAISMYGHPHGKKEIDAAIKEAEEDANNREWLKVR